MSDEKVMSLNAAPIFVQEDNKAIYDRYIDFTVPGSLANNVSITIKEGRKTVKSLQRTESIMKVVSTVLVYIIIVALALIVVFPFYWMIITSFKSNEEIRANSQTFFPTVVMWENYIEVFRTFDFVTYMTNTIVVAIFSTLGTLITTIFAAFAFARLDFAGKNALFFLFLATMMIPGEMMVISNYVTVAAFGWIGLEANLLDSYLANIIPFWVSVFYIYLLRQNFKQIPNELYLASKVDGKSDWNFLWKVMVPLASPTLISISILKFMGAWNSYNWPRLVANKEEFRLISNGLRGASFTDLEGNILYGYQMAATVIVTVPLFFLFVFFRKYIMKGVGRAGIKG